MALEFGNDFCTPSESSARVWHEGNDPFRCRPVVIIVVDDLQQIQSHQLARRLPLVNIPLTVWDSMNVLLLATKW